MRSSTRRRARLVLHALALCALSACDASCRSDISVSYELTDATAPPPPLAPARTRAADITREQALQVYERFRDACVRKDAQAVWDLLDDSTRRKTGEAAARLRQLGSADLKSVFGYDGPLDGFDAFELNRRDLDRPLNLCTDSRKWAVESEGPRGHDYVVVIGRGKGSKMEVIVDGTHDADIRVQPAPWFTPP